MSFVTISECHPLLSHIGYSLGHQAFGTGSFTQHVFLSLMTILHISVHPNTISSQINFIYTIMTSLGHIWPRSPEQNKLKLQGKVYNLFVLPPLFIFFDQCDNDHLKSIDSDCNQKERIRNTESVKFTIELNYIRPKSSFYPRREKKPKYCLIPSSCFLFTLYINILP